MKIRVYSDRDVGPLGGRQRRAVPGTHLGLYLAAAGMAIAVSFGAGGCAGSTSHPVGTRAVVIAHGTTAAGTRFIATLHPNELKPSHVLVARHGVDGPQVSGGCKLPVAIEDTDEYGLHDCLSRSAAAEAPEVFCTEPMLVVDAHTLAGTRAVRLRLSNGQALTSSPITISKSLGGSGGLYYQVVRGPDPAPISITELSGSARPVRTISLPRVSGCTVHAVKPLAKGTTTLVSGRISGGPRYSLVGEHYVRTGHLYFDLRLEFAKRGKPGRAAGGSSTLTTTAAERSPLALQLETGCTGPRAYVIAYGLLRRPGDAVVAHGNGRSFLLPHIPTPASIGIAGEVVFAVLPWFPDEVTARAPSGHQVFVETYRGLNATRCPGGPASTVGSIG